jgi:4-oxalocrotonate tautomerase family enzyme
MISCDESALCCVFCRGHAIINGFSTLNYERDHMPYVTISLTKGFPAETRKKLVQNASDAVVESIGAPLASVRVLLNELDDGHYLNAGQFGTQGLMYQIDLIEGRTNELKEALIGRLSNDGAAITGIGLDQVRVRLVDYPKSNMGMAGGKSALAMGR